MLQVSKFSEKCCTSTFLWEQMGLTLWITLHFCELPTLIILNYQLPDTVKESIILKHWEPTVFLWPIQNSGRMIQDYYWGHVLPEKQNVELKEVTIKNAEMLHLWRRVVLT
jgi:hypothetical protein